MTALSVTQNDSRSIELPPTTTCKSPKVTYIDTSALYFKNNNETNDFMMEESLECTAVISPSATTVLTSATTSDESDTKVVSHDIQQSCLQSLNDGPTNHQVQVNYTAVQAETMHKKLPKMHRRCKSTGNLPTASVLKEDDDDDDDDHAENSVDLLYGPVATTNQPLATAAISTSGNDTFTEWLVNGNDNYSCDVGNTFQAITTIAFSGSPSGFAAATKGLDNDDDASSIGSTSSVAYFDPSDFDSTTWRTVVWNHASTTAVGIVTVVALASAAIAHPLLFLAASAIAAVGTVTAAISQREIPSSKLSTNLIAITNQNDEMDSKNNEISSTASTMESSWQSMFCFENPFQNKVIDVPNTIKQSESTGLSKEPVESTKTTTISALVTIPTLTTAPSLIKRHALSKDDQADWLKKHFPPLFNMIAATRSGGSNYTTPSSVSLIGLNAIDFFHVFFDDEAPYSFQALQEKRGDLHIQYGLWNNLPMTGKISMFDHKDSISFPKDVSIRSYQGRLLTFHAKTNAMFGPPHAKTTKTQKFLLVNRRLAILESKTTLGGIPFADRFYVGERWIFIAEKVHKQHYVTHVQVSCEVFFPQGSCPFEQQIKSKSISTINDVVSSWCTMAVEALKLTEIAKLDRLQRTMDDDPDDDETIDEIPVNENPASDTKNDSMCNDEIEVVADASFLSDRLNPTATNQRPRSTLRGIKNFGRRRHSFDDDFIFAT